MQINRYFLFPRWRYVHRTKEQWFSSELIAFRSIEVPFFPSRVNDDTQQRQGKWNTKSSVRVSSRMDWLYSSSCISQAQIPQAYRSISVDRSLSDQWRSTADEHSTSSSRTIHDSSCQCCSSLTFFASLWIAVLGAQEADEWKLPARYSTDWRHPSSLSQTWLIGSVHIDVYVSSVISFTLSHSFIEMIKAMMCSIVE